MRLPSFLKKAVAGGLVLTLLLSAPIAAFAHGNKDHERNNKNNNKYKQEFQIKDGKIKGDLDLRLNFKDLDSDWDWVSKNIANLIAKRIFDGYEDGTFRPQRTVTRLEAIITAVRLMGLRDQAESEEEMETSLNFKDADLIERKYPQAVGYVAVAVENNLFAETETKIQPEKAADRLWVATMLVKALGLEKDAQSKMNVQLPFKDARDIPAGSVGYVAVAVDNKIVYGTSDNKFLPNKPVTRAEIAAFLDRAGMQLPDYNDGAIRGTVSGVVQGNVLHVVVSGTDQIFALDPNAFIFRNGVKVSASSLLVGDEVTIRTYNNLVIFVEVTKNASEQPTSATFNGTLTAKVSNQTLYIKHNNKDEQYKIASNAAIFRDGQAAATATLQIGDEVMVRVENSQVVWLLVTKKADTNDFTVSGTFQGVMFNSEGRIVTISINQVVNSSVQTSVYATTDEVTLQGDVSKLVIDHPIELKGTQGLIHTIVIK